MYEVKSDSIYSQLRIPREDVTGAMSCVTRDSSDPGRLTVIYIRRRAVSPAVHYYIRQAYKIEEDSETKSW